MRRTGYNPKSRSQSFPIPCSRSKSINAVSVIGQVDEKHQLFAVVPDSVPPGPVKVLVVPPLQEDDAGNAWMMGFADEWAGDLGDASQDIYTLADGAPVHAP